MHEDKFMTHTDLYLPKSLLYNACTIHAHFGASDKYTAHTKPIEMVGKVYKYESYCSSYNENKCLNVLYFELFTI